MIDKFIKGHHLLILLSELKFKIKKNYPEKILKIINDYK